MLAIHRVIPDKTLDIHRVFQFPSGAPQAESIKIDRRASALGGCTGPLNEQVSGRGGRSDRPPAGSRSTNNLDLSGEALGIDDADVFHASKNTPNQRAATMFSPIASPLTACSDWCSDG